MFTQKDMELWTSKRGWEKVELSYLISFIFSHVPLKSEDLWVQVTGLSKSHPYVEVEEKTILWLWNTNYINIQMKIKTGKFDMSNLVLNNMLVSEMQTNLLHYIRQSLSFKVIKC